MAGSDLWPQTERAASRAATAGVQRNIGVLAIGAVVFAEVEIAVVNLGHKREAVQLLAGQRRAIKIVRDLAIFTIADTQDLAPIPPLSHLFHGNVELFARSDINGRGRLASLF